MILVGEKFRISKDPYNWVLQKKRTVNPNHPNAKQTERWVDVGYFGNLKSVISRLLDEDLKERDINTLHDIKTLLEQSENILKIRLEEVTKCDL